MNKNAKVIAVFVLIVFVVLISFIGYHTALNQNLKDSVKDNLTEVAQQQRAQIYHEITEDMQALENMAQGYDLLSEEDAALLLDRLLEGSGFASFAFVDTSGKGVDSEGRTVDVSGEAFFERALSGEEPQQVQMEQDQALPIAVPMRGGADASLGVLIGYYQPQALQDLAVSSFEGKGNSYLTDSSGGVIASFDEGSVTEGLNLPDRATVLEFDSVEQIKEKMSRKESGYTICDLGGTIQYMHYTPVGIHDWYLFVASDYEGIVPGAQTMTTNAMVLTILIVICFGILMLSVVLLHRKNTKALRQMAYYDKLTGLPNLNRFKMEAQEFIDTHPDTNLLMVKLDVENFKLINETLGVPVGDKVLRAIGWALKDGVKDECERYARGNDDAFHVLHFYEKKEDVSKIRGAFFTKLYELLGKDFQYNLRVIAGHYYMATEHCKDVSEAIEKANIALKTAKKRGEDICVYDESFVKEALKKKDIENRMEAALNNRDFIVYLQPQYRISDETVLGAEALVRWGNSVDKSVVGPAEFIPVFEQNGFITRLDMYVFEHVCEMIRGWIDLNMQPVPVSVNFSRLHLSNPKFAETLCDIANQYRVPHRFLVVEVTESVMVSNEHMLVEALEILHKDGFALAMDDFGTGYSSLALLKNLPVDIIKIDRSFFTDNRYKTRAKILIESVMQMAKKLRIETIAEGVESEEHIEFLREVGCDLVQGYYYARPMPMEEFLEHRRAMPPDRELEFDLSRLGDITKGRAEMGEEIPVVVFRLFQSTMRDVLEDTYGEGEMVQAFQNSGRLAGRAFARDCLNLQLPLYQFMENLKEQLAAFKIGVLGLESDLEHPELIVLTVANDADCSGACDQNKTLCQYDEGFIAGVLYEYTKLHYSVVEVDCWGNGSNICRFEARLQ